MSKFYLHEIIKVLDAMIGETVPVADSAIDAKIEDNVKNLIDVINWCLDGVYDTARNRKSEYGSQRDIGERAYSAMLEWRDWLSSCEEELA